MIGRTSPSAHSLWKWCVSNVWLIQSVYYTVTGIWPLIEIRSFQAITGPKTDLWLVKTVGIAVAAIGAAIGVAGRRGAITPETVQLATSAALGLAAVESSYALRGRISKVYLVDALVNVLFTFAWIARQNSDDAGSASSPGKIPTITDQEPAS